MRFSRSAAFEVHDLGRSTYEEVDRLMVERVEKVSRGEAPDQLLIAEFEPVLTVGRAGDVQAYQHLEIPIHAISRGGKATFHGPGQVVAYPIIHLAADARDLHAYLHALEEALIACVGDFGLLGERDPRNTGCWVKGKKIASIGVAVRRWTTYHGVALNLSTDLSWFHRFDPCGLDPNVMTTMAEELGEQTPSFAEVAQSLARHMKEVLCEQNRS